MTAGELQQRTLERAGDGTGTFPTLPQALAALNQAQRLFCLITLCQETTAPLALTANTRFYHLLSTWFDWIAPLRIRVHGVNGAKVIPARIADLDALNPSWQTAVGSPKRYVSMGFDFATFDQVPNAPGVTLDVTYAQAPPALVSAADVPVIPEQFHPCLMDWAVPRLRAVEGGQEFSKNLGQVQAFLEEAHKLATYVRARNLAHRYDTMPFELRRFDRSTLSQIVGDAPWPTMLQLPQAQAPA